MMIETKEFCFKVDQLIAYMQTELNCTALEQFLLCQAAAEHISRIKTLMILKEDLERDHPGIVDTVK